MPQTSRVRNPVPSGPAAPRPPAAAPAAAAGSPAGKLADWRARLRERAPGWTPDLATPRDASATAALAEETVVMPRRAVDSLLAAALVIAGLYFGRDLLVPFALAALFAFVLDPLVTRLRRLAVPRSVATGVVVLATMAALGGVGAFVGSQVVAIGKSLPTYQSTIQQKFRSLRAQLAVPGAFDGASRVATVVEREVDQTRRALQDAEQAKPPLRVQIDSAPKGGWQALAAAVAPAIDPLLTAGIVIVFTIFMLLERNELRDRLLRIVRGDLHRMTDALDEAARRVSRYLTMQLAVNVGYGIPMALGLWWIGVPGAMLWGALAAVMRFIPYVGPVVAAVAPLTMAFAVDPGWDMLLWTGAFILTMELVLNNFVEPLVYGNSTGISAVALMMSAAFWTALWGPIGLVLSTPLTVVLVVMGRHLPHLQFLDVLLGSGPVFDPPTRLYQRLLAGNVDDAMEIAQAALVDASPQAFYNDVAIPALRLATHAHGTLSNAEQRLRVASGMAQLIDDLRVADDRADAPTERPRVLVLAARWEVDTLAAQMMAHAMNAEGLAARAAPPPSGGSGGVAELDLRGLECVCISTFSPHPEGMVRALARRLRDARPALKIVVLMWEAAPALFEADAVKRLGADAAANSLTEALLRAQTLVRREGEAYAHAADVPADEEERLRSLEVSGALEASLAGELDAFARRTAEVFDAPMAVVAFVDRDTRHWQGYHGPSSMTDERKGPRASSIVAHVVATSATLVVPDVARDVRFANNPDILRTGMRAYAGAPIRDAEGHTLGALAVFDREPRTPDARELRLLEAMAGDIWALVKAQRAAPSRNVPHAGTATGLAQRSDRAAAA